MIAWVIWKDDNNKINKVKFSNYNVARKFYDHLKPKYYKVKEMSSDEYGVACGLYKVPLDRQILLAC